MFAGTALSVHLFVCAGLSLFIIYGPYLYVVVCVFYAYNLTLTKARFMEQMEKITKELKKDTLLTHNYSIPKPTNQTVLTNTLSQKTPNNILIPDIETNVQEQLNCLGISNLLPTATTKSNEESSQTASPSTRSLPHENSTTT